MYLADTAVDIHPATLKPPLVEAKALTLRYPGHAQPVFAGIDLHIHAKEIVAVLGESGCGKSSLLSLLAGLAMPASGEVCFQGKTVRRPPKQMAVVFQDPCLLPWLCVASNAHFGLDFRSQSLPRKQRRARVTQALADVGLSAYHQAYPHQLSGGMAQRVALARALARQPELILLDEPFSALDALTREAMQDLLVNLVHQRASAAFLVTHDIDEALRVADRILLMGGCPAQLVGEWSPLRELGPAPRQRHTQASLWLREDILDTLSQYRLSDTPVESTALPLSPPLLETA